MGMFDTVIYDVPCLNCREPLHEFQSKDGECTLATFTPMELIREGGIHAHFYTDCDKCGTWNEYTFEPPTELCIIPANTNT